MHKALLGYVLAKPGTASHGRARDDYAEPPLSVPRRLNSNKKPSQRPWKCGTLVEEECDNIRMAEKEKGERGEERAHHQTRPELEIDNC